MSREIVKKETNLEELEVNYSFAGTKNLGIYLLKTSKKDHDFEGIIWPKTFLLKNLQDTAREIGAFGRRKNGVFWMFFLFKKMKNGIFENFLFSRFAMFGLGLR